MVPQSAQFMKRLGIQATFESYLLHCFTAFIKCNIKFFKGMSKIVKDFKQNQNPVRNFESQQILAVFVHP